MDENFNPNRAVVDEYGALPGIVHGGKPDLPRNHGAAVADVKESLIAALGKLGDGDVAVVGDLVAVRAGPATYHPIKAIKVRTVLEHICLVEPSAVGALPCRAVFLFENVTKDTDHRKMKALPELVGSGCFSSPTEPNISNNIWYSRVCIVVLRVSCDTPSLFGSSSSRLGTKSFTTHVTVYTTPDTG